MRSRSSTPSVVGFCTRKLRRRESVARARQQRHYFVGDPGVIGAANALNWVIATQQVPAMVGASLDAVVSSKWMLLALMNVVFLIAGMLLEGISAMILLVPILLPAADGLGHRSAAVYGYRADQPEHRARHAAGGPVPLHGRRHRPAEGRNGVRRGPAFPGRHGRSVAYRYLLAGFTLFLPRMLGLI